MKANKQQGQIIIIAIVFMAVLMAAAAALLGYTTLNVRGTRQAYGDNQALYLAEAGFDKAIYELNQNSNYSGETDTQLDSGTFTVSVATLDASNKRITVTGFIPSSASPKYSKTIKATATINTADIAFNNGVQVGEGGMTMGNGSQVNGNVFSNGTISGGGTVSAGKVTGDVIVAEGTPAVADQEWTVQNGQFLLGNSSSRRDAAQSFSPSVSGKVNKVSLYIKKIGTPGDLTIRILTTGSNQPTKTVLADTTLSASWVTANYNFIDAAFLSPATLVAGTKYWLLVSSANASASNYFDWGMDFTDAYPPGTGMYSDNWNSGNPTWNIAGGDFDFKVYVGGVLTKLDGINVDGNARATEIDNCRILQNAYFITNNSCTITGTSFPGTAAPGPAAMPISDAQINAWESTAAGGGIINGDYIVSGTQSLGPVEIIGNLSFANGSTLKLTGPVWVRGNITIDNLAIVQVDSALGNAGTVLLADDPSNPATAGLVTISPNSDVRGNGNTNSFPLILTTNTSSSAMTVSNNSSGAIYYASKGTIRVSNNAGGNQVTGYAIVLENNSTITYLSGLQNSLFSNGPGGSWGFLAGSYVIMP